MRAPYTVLAVALAAVANAQLPNIPSCALSCFVTALTSDGCASIEDFACHCQKPTLISSITPCVKAACSAADQATVISTVESTCVAAGHPISIPSTDSATSSSVASSSSSSVASVASTTSVVPTTTTSTVVSSSSSAAPPSSSSSVAETTTSTASVVVPPVASATIVPSSSANGTVTSATPTASSYTGGAEGVRVGSAGVFALAMGFAYLL